MVVPWDKVQEKGKVKTKFNFHIMSRFIAYCTNKLATETSNTKKKI